MVLLIGVVVISYRYNDLVTRTLGFSYLYRIYLVLGLGGGFHLITGT